MASECNNHLIIAGPLRSLMHFRADTNDRLCMDKLVPIEDPLDYDEADQIWGCAWIRDVEYGAKVCDNGIACLDYQFTSLDDPPVEFIRKASIIYPLLEFHLQYKDSFRVVAGQVSYSGGILLKEIRIESMGMDSCFEEYLSRHKPEPRGDGLSENPDPPEPNHNKDTPAMTFRLQPDDTRKASN